MSEDKKKKSTKTRFYFIQGMKPGLIFDPVKECTLVQVNKRGMFITKKDEVAEVLREKGYEEISEETIKRRK